MSIEDEAAKIASRADLIAGADDQLLLGAQGGAVVATYRSTLVNQGVPVKEARDLTASFAVMYWTKMFDLGCSGHEGEG